MNEKEILELEGEILQLKASLKQKEDQLSKIKKEFVQKNIEIDYKSDVPRWAIERYSRQALLGELGPPKEIIKNLMNGSVLIVGAGGLGCPAAIYLAGAGVGRIGIVDYDTVELTNLHRQPLHSELTLDLSKVDSAASALKRMNSHVIVEPYNLQLDSSNALDIVSKYDVIVDATDNAVTRYLINDACILAKKPLVSAAALQLSGQFTVYNYPPRIDSNDTDEIESCPCYRCIFPTPPPPETMGSCSQNGVLGPVPGVMGCLQAIEAIKILLGKPTIAGYLLMFDALDWTFTKVKLRKRNPNCAVCSKHPKITKLIDYEQFCSARASDKDLKLKILSEVERIHPESFFKNVYSKSIKDINFSSENSFTNENKLFIDVRSVGEFEMCNIPKFENFPIDKINYDTLAENIKQKQVNEVYFLCRRGNDSQIAAKELQKKWTDLYGSSDIPVIRDITNGLHEWSKTVDNNFPIY